ncbi:uncharacterized protein LOC123529734 [Mercenaria mercenaria]|uniref:uncharacterized protein LOC123529734 n=1 Tax=Mercenaria mercenaria TaxID=6596 RepID=UPI00234F13EC|nr:uncharacterized protein LOC123529734 [Mercenaria mercenaria]
MILHDTLIFITVFYSVTTASEKPCCTSKKFFGQIKVTTGLVKNGIPRSMENTFQFDYNADMHMERAIGHIYDSSDRSSQHYKIFNDYRHGKRYGFYGSDSTTCVVTPIDPDAQPVNCVPDELKHEGTLAVGSGNMTIQANAWSGYASNMHWRMQTSVRDCTPISLTRYGIDTDGIYAIEITTYSNITQYRLSSADALVIPDECKHSAVATGK